MKSIEFTDPAVHDEIRSSHLFATQHVALTGAVSINECQTIAELGFRALTILRQMGIAPDGGIVALSHSVDASAKKNTMIISGTEGYAGLTGKNPDHIPDEKIRSALTTPDAPHKGNDLILRKQSRNGESIVFYLPRHEHLDLIEQVSLQAFIQATSFKFEQLYNQERSRQLLQATVVSLAHLAEYKDRDNGDHVLRVARLSEEIAWMLHERGKMDNPEDFPIDQIGIASILHDVGKIAIPERIILKPGPLSAEERAIVETHTELGSELLSKAFLLAEDDNYLKLSYEIARWHHEWYNGKGYPDKLSGEQIPLSARIVAIVDVFDALSSKRPHKEAWPLQKAIDFIREREGTQFDPDVVDAFVSVMKKRAILGMIQWQPDMSVGNEAIDHDHMNLITLFNQLGLAQLEGNRHVVIWVLDELVNYTLSHFKREEDLLEKCAYLDLKNHRRIHQNVARKIKEIRQQYNLGLREHIESDLLVFLNTWLNDHIRCEDRKYVPALNVRGAGSAFPSYASA